MHRATAIAAIAAGLAVSAGASAEFTVNLGTVMQTLPRPSIVYSGSYGAFISSGVDSSGARTITSFDLAGIAGTLGGNLALVEVRVRDVGTNSYGSYSPGADIDLVRIGGADLSGGTVTVGYQGSVAQHVGEGASVLKSRISVCDAVSGDQHFNSQHFISLGLNGLASMRFSDFVWGADSSGGGGTGTGGSGPGGWTGGGGTGGETRLGGLIIQSGMRLEIGEAGTGETYGVDLVFEQVTVPAPGAAALFGLAGVFGRRGRRR
jgi:hypothetical protein